MIGNKLENKKINKKKPLKLSSSGRLQIRKNLGPTGSNNKNQGNKKTIQIVFRNKNNQQKSSSTTQSNFRGSSSFRTSTTQNLTLPNSFLSKTNKNFHNKAKKMPASKKNQSKRSTLKPAIEDSGKLNLTKILEKESFNTSSIDDLSNKCNISDSKLVINMLKICESEKLLIRINQNIFITNSNILLLKTKLKDFFKRNNLLTVSDLKNLVGTSRKYAIPILEYLDKINFTYRSGNNRKLI